MTTQTQDDLRHVVDGCNQFAIDLYRQLGDDRYQQFFFSPYSIACALGMTLVGAKGRTAEEIAEVLHLSIPLPRIHQAFAELFTTTRTDGIQFHLANRLWCQQGYDVQPEAMRVLENCYRSQIGLVDFQESCAACDEINRWVADQTSGKITDLIDSLPALTRLVLTNAIYFAAHWEQEFDDLRTQDAFFHAAPGRSTSVQMMGQKGHFPYAEHPLGQVVQMGYQASSQEPISVVSMQEDPDNETELPPLYLASPSDFAMKVILPREQGQLLALECHLEQFITLTDHDWESRLVRLELPKFSIDSSEFLASPLQGLGMQQAFEPLEANFQGFSLDPEGLYVDEVIHQAKIEVNETGTVAAAATAIVMCGGSAHIDELPITFRADHPFTFLIQDTRTGLIHFMGRVTCPIS